MVDDRKLPCGSKLPELLCAWVLAQASFHRFKKEIEPEKAAFLDLKAEFQKQEEALMKAYEALRNFEKQELTIN